MREPDKIESMSVGQFGLMPNSDEDMEILEDEESEDEIEEESEEPEDEVDASGDEDDEDDSEDENEDDSDDGKNSHWRKKAEAAEKQMREWQSRHDSAIAQHRNALQQIYSEFQALKQQLSKPETSADFDIDDDDIVTGKQLKELKEKSSHTEQQLRQATNVVQQLRQRMQVQDQWVNQQSDIQEIRKYIQEHKLLQDSNIVNIPTDEVGYYYLVKARMLEDKLSAKEKAHDKDLSSIRRRKKKVPPTGGSIRSKGKDAVSDFERKFSNTFSKWGFE